MDFATAQKAPLVSFPRTWNSLYIVGTSLGLKCYNSKYITDIYILSHDLRAHKRLGCPSSTSVGPLCYIVALSSRSTT